MLISTLGYMRNGVGGVGVCRVGSPPGAAEVHPLGAEFRGNLYPSGYNRLLSASRSA